MVSSIAEALATPYAAVIGLICFLTCASLLVFKRRALSRKAATTLLILLTLSVLYYLFVLWLAVGFGSNPGTAPTPHPIDALF